MEYLSTFGVFPAGEHMRESGQSYQLMELPLPAPLRGTWPDPTRNGQLSPGGLVSKAHRLCVSLNSGLESNKPEGPALPPEMVTSDRHIYMHKCINRYIHIYICMHISIHISNPGSSPRSNPVKCHTRALAGVCPSAEKWYNYQLLSYRNTTKVEEPGFREGRAVPGAASYVYI